MKAKFIMLIVIGAMVLFWGCGREFLDIKRNANQVVPRAVKDYLAIVSMSKMSVAPIDLAFLGADEYHVPSSADLIAGSQYTPFHKNAHVWADDVFEHEPSVRDWHEAYENIMYANLALDVEKIAPTDKEREDWNRTRIAARFYRAWNFYHLAQIFCATYDSVTAEKELGLPLRLDYDVSVKYGRSTLQAVYDQIFKDLHDASDIPLSSDDNIYLPGRIAVEALLARVYLQIGDYGKAQMHAENVLAQRNTMVDYNLLSGNISGIYDSYYELDGKNNPSVLLYSYRAVGGILGGTRFHANEDYLSMYDTYDLRKAMNFFEPSVGRKVFIGSYSGAGVNNPFTGLSVEEMYLIYAECLARKENVQDAMKALNALRKNRCEIGSDYAVSAENKDRALQLIFSERKKELYMRGRRWEDARRLNREGRYTVSFRREIEGNIYQLLPNSKKWVWPIPVAEIINNGLTQNPR